MVIVDLELCISVSAQGKLSGNMQFGLIMKALCVPKNGNLCQIWH